jgi:hypothetical protein
MAMASDTYEPVESDTEEREVVDPASGVAARSHLIEAAAEILAGAAAGAAVGSIAGPPGVVAGTVIGTLVGAAAEVVLERDRTLAARRDAALDAAIGVIGGHIGEASPHQSSPRRGVFSAASMGISGGGTEPAEGPMQNVDPG